MSSNNPTLSSPAAFASFADLAVRSTTHDALARMNISEPTRIQAETLPMLLSGRDVIGQSRTGSGKTLAFGIPAVEVVDVNVRAVQVLVLTPTRELAVQVGEVFSQLVAGTGIRVALVFGGRSIGPQISELRRGAQVVVGTPGRIADLYSQRALQLNGVRFLVLDEADEMLDRGFAPQVNQILSWTPPQRQTALFSATMPDWVNDASNRHLRNPYQVAVQSTQAESESIDHIAYDVPAGGKLDALKDILDARGDGQVIVFGRTKHGVRKLAKQMALAGYPVAALQGNLSQNARDAVMADFRAGKVPVLLATNVAARGIDVTAVDYVVNFELPESSELLSHRIGRTGRMGRSGQAITLLGEEDAQKWRQLERGLGKRIPRQAWTGARRTDSNPVIVEHTSPERRPTSRPARPAAARDSGNRSPRQSAPTGERRDDNRQARPDNRQALPDNYGNERTSDTRRDGNRSQRPPESTAPIQRRRSSIPVISQIITEQRGAVEPPVHTQSRPPAREQRQHTARPNGSRPQSSSNGHGPRGSQTQDGTGRPSWGSRPAPRVEETDEYGTPARGNARSGNSPDRRRDSADRAPRGNRTDSPRSEKPSSERHSATCTGCGQTAMLRFAPDLSRPVYCDKCYGERRKSRPSPSPV